MLFPFPFSNLNQWGVGGKCIRMKACSDFYCCNRLRMGFCRIVHCILFLAISLLSCDLRSAEGYGDDPQQPPLFMDSSTQLRKTQHDRLAELLLLPECRVENKPDQEMNSLPENTTEFLAQAESLVQEGGSQERQQTNGPVNADSGESDKATQPADTGDLTSKPQSKEDDFEDLITPELGTFWKCYSSDNKSGLSDVWKVLTSESGQPPVLVCSGQPKGFLFTAETYSDFELTLDWKFPTDANGNSGVLVYLQDEPRIWPTSMQIQFHQPKAGSVFPSGDAKSANTSESDLAGPFNSWNSCRIVSRSGQLSVEINGKKAGEITGAVPATGSVALQSEGAEVHFRKIRIRRLKPDSVLPGQDSPSVSLPEKALPVK